jgi:hypothetical protein
MKVNDICRVLVDKGRGHPKGTEVRIVLIAPEEYHDPEPYYCQTLDGLTSYWYSGSQLLLLEEGNHDS